jgi:membrane-bound ClpP family serine protease
MKPRTKYHLVIFQQGGFPFDEGRLDTIQRALVYDIQALLDEKITTNPENTDIDIWLESPGGDAHSAYKLILDLRSRCTNLCVIIPDCAKSAATLIALGADCIYMAPAAELGPLDVQLQHPDKENVQISGLDVTNSLIYLTRTALDLTIAGGVGIIKWTQLPMT